MRYEKTESGLFMPIIGLGRYHGVLIHEDEITEEFDCDNLVVNQGLNHLLATELGGGPQITAWYLGLFQGNYTPQGSDTGATIAGNATECSAYTAGARQLFQPTAAATQQITNSAAQASFTFNATATIYGAFLVSSGVINGNSGTLFSAAQFGTPKNVVSGDQLLVTYTFAAASS